MTTERTRAREAERLAQRDRLMLAVLPNIAFDGWTRRALHLAGDSVGMNAGAADDLFPRGTIDLIAHFSDWADRQMLEALAGHEGFEELKVREKITLGVRTRLEILEPHRDAERRALAVLSMPGNGVVASRLLYRTVDALWHAAGDVSTDYNFYTKRGLLAAVQGSTLLYWLGDSSEGHEASWAFLDRRIANALALGRTAGRASRVGRVICIPARLAASAKRRCGGRIRSLSPFRARNAPA